MELAARFEAERPRIIALATRMLDDADEAQDIAQQAWLRLDRVDGSVDNLPAWLTTVTVRLSLDRLKARVPMPADDQLLDQPDPSPDPAEDLVLADTVAAALTVVLDRLSPKERVAFVLHDTFGFEFPAIAALLDTSPAAARQLASRARAKVGQPSAQDALADWEVVDAFLDAARNGEFARLLELLAPDVLVSGDAAAIAIGTPARLEGRDAAATFFNGAAKAALPVYVGERPGAAWFDRGIARVAFDFTVRDGQVASIVFRADPETLAELAKRRGGQRR